MWDFGCNKVYQLISGLPTLQFIIFTSELLTFLWNATHHIKIIWWIQISKRALMLVNPKDIFLSLENTFIH